MSESLKPFVEQLKQRVSIVEIVGRSVPLKPRGKNWWGCCPFHNEKTASFSVNEELNIYKCFGCGEGGDVITFLMKKHGMQYLDAVRELAAIAGVSMPDFHPRDPEEENRERAYFDILNKAADMYSAALPDSPAAAYLARRALSAEIIKKYRLGYAPKNNIIASRFGAAAITAGLSRHSKDGGADYDFFRNRLMIPISDSRGNVIAFAGRSLDGSEPKYINIAETEFFQKRRTLFGINFALPEMRLRRRAIVVEGHIDAIQMQAHGFGETVAPMGTALTTEHIQILLKHAKQLVFCFDGDVAGDKAAARTASLVLSELKADMSVGFAFMTGGKDPDEVLRGGGDMGRIINGAKSLPDFGWGLANKNFAVATEAGRVQADRWLYAEYNKIPDLKLREEYLSTLKNREFDEWKRFRRTIAPEMKAPDPTKRQAGLIAEIAEKFPELYEANFELLGVLPPDVPHADTGMKRERAVKIIKEIELKKQLDGLISDRAAPAAIQRVKDAILDLWN